MLGEAQVLFLWLCHQPQHKTNKLALLQLPLPAHTQFNAMASSQHFTGAMSLHDCCLLVLCACNAHRHSLTGCSCSTSSTSFISTTGNRVYGCSFCIATNCLFLHGCPEASVTLGGLLPPPPSPRAPPVLHGASRYCEADASSLQSYTLQQRPSTSFHAHPRPAQRQLILTLS